MNKAELRKIAAQKRSLIISPNAENLLFRNFPIEFKNKTIAGFIPIKSELSPLSLMKSLNENGAKLCLPRIENNNLCFHEYNFADELINGPFGTQEPKPDSKTIAPDIILTPLLAFDENGNRLGYGGGFYDRAFVQFPKAIKIGIAYEAQQISHIPTEDHDIKLDFLITEFKAFSF